MNLTTMKARGGRPHIGSWAAPGVRPLTYARYVGRPMRSAEGGPTLDPVTPPAPARASAPATRPRVIASVGTACVAAVGALASGHSWSRADMRGRMGAMSGMGDIGRMGGADSPSLPADSVANPPAIVALLIALAVALGVAVWLSGRHPRTAYGATLALSAAYLALNGPLPVALVAPALALASVMRRRPQREWLGWIALLIPMFWARTAFQPGLGLDDPLTFGVVFFGVAWVLLPAVVLQLTGARRAALASAREDELRRVAYEERLRVARDIHDVVGHSLSMISLQSGVALHVLDSNPAQARASLEAIRDASKSSLAELRHTLGVFRQPDEAQPLVPTPSLAGVGALVESVRAGGRPVGLVLPSDAAAGVPLGVQTVAYRVIQEGLTNVVRHANGASAVVTAERRPDALVVAVADDGPTTSDPVEGNGLRGMRERVASVGGTVSVGVRPGGGVRVEAVLPVGDDR